MFCNMTTGLRSRQIQTMKMFQSFSKHRFYQPKFTINSKHNVSWKNYVKVIWISRHIILENWGWVRSGKGFKKKSWWIYVQILLYICPSCTDYNPTARSSRFPLQDLAVDLCLLMGCQGSLWFESLLLCY